MIQFMKNLSMIGAMLFVIANGSGPMSLDFFLTKLSKAQTKEPAVLARAN
jgi:putative oxidoreductase